MKLMNLKWNWFYCNKVYEGRVNYDLGTHCVNEISKCII